MEKKKVTPAQSHFPHHQLKFDFPHLNTTTPEPGKIKVNFI